VKPTLKFALQIAKDAHSGQLDRAGNPYILHPMHLMAQFSHDEELAIIAVLHDVVEDTNVSLDALHRAGFSQRVLQAIWLLTHDKRDTYDAYIEKIATNVDAICVKLEDLAHNMDLTRLARVTEKDLKRVEKYKKAYAYLQEKLYACGLPILRSASPAC
jgi:(p)ppGpp synthase/HD superfamily hydrolase